MTSNSLIETFLMVIQICTSHGNPAKKSAENFPSSLGFTSLSRSLVLPFPPKPSNQIVVPQTLCGIFPVSPRNSGSFQVLECLKTTFKVLGDRGDYDQILSVRWRSKLMSKMRLSNFNEFVECTTFPIC